MSTLIFEAGDIDFRFTSRFGLEEVAKGHRRLQAIFPDLFWLGVQGDYEFIEVKGPGDRLQKHQSRWLSFFVEQGIPCRVVYVSR